MVGPRVEMIEGQQVLVVERKPPLQRSLDRLLAALSPVWISHDIRPRGASASCEGQNVHRFAILREGRHVGLDGVVRDLRIEMCEDCGAACVRDVSRDRIAGLSTGGQALRRRDLILGWFTAPRRAGRTYHGPG